MQLSEHLYPLLIFLPLAGASLYVWGRSVRALFRTKPFAPRIEPVCAVPSVLLGMGMLLIVLQILLPSIFFQLFPVGENASELNQTLNRVHIGIAVDLFSVLIGFLGIGILPREERRFIGLHWTNPQAQILSGITGFTLAILPVALLVAAVAPFKKPEHLHGMLQLIAAEPSFEVIAWIVISAVVTAPLSEELMYRVLIQEGIIASGYPPRLVIPGVAIFFCLNHGNPADPSSFLQTLPLLPLALLLGWTYHARNSFLASVLMHLLFNTFNILILLSTMI